MSRTVVVTGCSSGFGHQVSAQLAWNGDRVYATMRGVEGKNAAKAGELRTLAAKEKIDLRVMEMDVTSDQSVDAAAARVLAESGAPDVVINNAGQMFVGIGEAFTAEEFTEQLDVNVVGIHRVTRAFLPAMRERGKGLIINLSSVAGRVAVPFNSLYHASKWAVEGYSLALRRELASSGIDVVVVEPGPFTTALFPSMRLPEDAEGRTSTYPEAARQVFQQMGASFEGMLKNPDLPTAPGLVVDRMIELTGMKPGTRPFRSVVGLDFGARELNASAEPHEAALMETMGLTAFATIAPTRTA
jgi:NAD(P)-dependent dehydrogenase (short-subunit alcohol dehydrogenase family)